MKKAVSENGSAIPRGSFLLLVIGTVLLVCGSILLIHALIGRAIARDFLRDGVRAEAAVASVERRGAKHGGRRIEVRFWDKTGRDSLVGKFTTSPITDLLPIVSSGEREGDEIEIRWREIEGRLRVAPETSLHPGTRPPELSFAFGIWITASGTSLLGWFRMREARRRERPGDPSIRR